MMMNSLLLFPDTCTVSLGSLTIASCNLSDLANEYGTPLYLYDRTTMDSQVKIYRDALADSFPGKSSLTYASKAYLCLAIAEWTQQHGMRIDCTGLGEISIARAAGVPAERILVHGVNKSAEDLKAACDNAEVLVVDNLTELDCLMELSKSRGVPNLWLRFQPGVTVETHSYSQTGQSGSKFGMDAEQILCAAQNCREHGLAVKGIHFHLGSQFRDIEPLIPAISHTLDLAVEIILEPDWTLSAGGGWGVAYHENELPQPDTSKYVELVAAAVVKGCRERNLALPCLNLEPGRSLVAKAGVALYRVGAVKELGGRKWVLLDGGLADNPRPALYHARYQAFRVSEPEREPVDLTWFAGPYCESGDMLIEAQPFPEIGEGELVAVPVSGAYQLSMSSNYNGARRPAVLWLDRGRAQVIQERESIDGLYRRDHRLVKPDGSG